MKARLCSECGARIQDGADKCPHCGLEQSRIKHRRTLVNILGIIGLAMVVSIIFLFSCSRDDKRFEMAGQYKGPEKETVQFFYLTSQVEESELRTHALHELSAKHTQAVFYYTHPVGILAMEGLDSFEKVVEAACHNRPAACAWYIPPAGEENPTKNFRMYPSYPLSAEKPGIREYSSPGEKPIIIKL